MATATSTAQPSRDDFAKMLEESFAQGSPQEGAVVKGTVVSVDGERVQVFPVGGRRPRAVDGDAEAQESRNREPAADAGLNVRVTVKAGPRAVAATFIERSSVETRAAVAKSALSANRPSANRKANRATR